MGFVAAAAVVSSPAAPRLDPDLRRSSSEFARHRSNLYASTYRTSGFRDLNPWILRLPARSSRCRRRLRQVPRAAGTEQEDLSVSEDMEEAGASRTAKEAASDYAPCNRHDADATLDKAGSIRTVALCVGAAVTFGVAFGLKEGMGKASEFFAGYILEQSLSVDNLFVFILIFKYFKVPAPYQGQVLTYGIAGTIIFRAVMILLGTATLQRFEVVNLILALILLFSSYMVFSSGEDDHDLADNFIVKTCQKFIPVTAYYDGNRFLTVQDGVWKATPLLLTVIVVELIDIAFAVDSIPAVFGVTRDPVVVFSSNLFAISGLRALYVVISESMSELEYLQPAIGVVLGFVGAKMMLDFGGYHVSTEASLGFVSAVIGTGVLLSLMKKSK